MNERESLDRDLKAIFECEKVSLDLLSLAGRLDPKKDFVGSNLRGIYLAGNKLQGFNFTDADLRDTFIRLAQVDSTTILYRAKLDIEDELALHECGLLVRKISQTAPSISAHERSLEQSIDRLRRQCVELTREIDANPDDASLQYQFGLALASIGTFEARLCRFNAAAHSFTESCRIISNIEGYFESEQLLEGLIQRLSAEINRYSAMRSQMA